MDVAGDMTSDSAASDDYSAQLRSQLWSSERLRSAAVIILLLGGAAAAGARDLLSLQYSGVWAVAALAFLLVLAGAELLWYLLLRRKQRSRGRLPLWMVAAGSVVEANLPTAGIILLTANPSVGPFRALATPAVTLYFLFIILAALRMRPWLCVLSGAAASIGYLSVVAFTWMFFASHRTVDPLTSSFSISVAVMMLFAGVLSAVVSRQTLQSASRAIAAAIKQQKLERDLAIARQIQRSLLPAVPPKTRGFDVAGRSDPADQTGGDAFDWLTLGDGHVIVTLTDVMGHGIGPALLAANLHAYVHALFRPQDGLCECVSRLNRCMAADSVDGRFATFVAALLRPHNRCVEVMSAGHGPILFYQAASGRVAEFDSQGLPLGVAAEAEYSRPTQMAMAAGDVLVLITDGFFEQSDEAGAAFGLERLKESIGRHAQGSANDMVEALYAEINAFSRGASQADDYTVVAIRRAE